MIKAVEDALTAFLDAPLKIGAICIEAKKEEWKLFGEVCCRIFFLKCKMRRCKKNQLLTLRTLI
jgi:hypothetical protein